MLRSLATNLTESERLVLFVLRYSSIFNFALTATEVFNRLPKSINLDYLFTNRSESVAAPHLSQRQVNNALKNLQRRHILAEEQGYFFLKSRDYQLRKARAALAIEKELHLNEFLKLARKVPWVKAVVLTGSTAVANAADNDDLDFLLITSKNTLWLCRLLLLFLSQLKGKRPHLDTDRRSRTEARNAWCFNLWLDEAALAISPQRRSLYEAYEVLQMRWLYDPQLLQTEFLRVNPWLKDYLQFFDQQKLLPPQVVAYNFINYCLWPFNFLAFLIQRSYRRLFHPQDRFELNLRQAYFSSTNFRQIILHKLR